MAKNILLILLMVIVVHFSNGEIAEYEATDCKTVFLREGWRKEIKGFIGYYIKVGDMEVFLESEKLNHIEFKEKSKDVKSIKRIRRPRMGRQGKGSR